MTNRQQQRQSSNVKIATVNRDTPSETQPHFLAKVSPPRTTVLAILIALLIINVVAYAGIWHYGFVNYDDPEYITGNPDVTAGLTWHGVVWAFTTGRQANWHPLTWLSHMLDVQLYGLNAGAHHLTNLLLHIGSTALLFLALLQLTSSIGSSFLVAALFAVHPLHVESVAWISERKDVLSTFFWALTLCAYAHYVRQQKLRRYVWVLICFGLGLMAKPMLVTLPFVLLLLDSWPLRRITADNWRANLTKCVQEKLPLLALAGVSSTVTFIVQQRGGAMANIELLPITSRIANACTSYVMYIWKTLWPVGLAVFYPTRHHVSLWWLAAALFLIVLSVQAVRGASRRPYITVGWFWFVVALIPVIGLVQVGRQSMADRYTYVPSIGLFLIVAYGVNDLFETWRHRKIVLPIAAVLTVLVCTGLTMSQVRYWRSNEALWNHALAVTSENAVAHYSLALAAGDDGRTEEAIQHYIEALRIEPQYPEAHYNLGNALAKNGEMNEAVVQYLETLRINPQHPKAHYNLGLAFVSQGKSDEAILHYREALHIDPTFVEAHNSLGIQYQAKHRMEDAISEFSEAIRLNPNYASAHNNLGTALGNQGKVDDAVAQYREAVRIDSRYALPYNNLGILLAGQGKTNEALDAFSTALKIDPANKTAQAWRAKLINSDNVR
jgi:tetratricopeptide (TPR) repeat protein